MMDFLLEHAATGDELQGALAHAFGVPLAEVAVVADIASLDPFLATQVTAEAIGVKGEFEMLVSIFIERSVCQRDELGVAQVVAKTIGCDVLIPDDDTADPYAAKLVNPSGTVVAVALRVDALDDRGEYWLAHEEMA